MKVRLLRKLRREAFNEIRGYSVRKFADRWEVCGVKYSSRSTWVDNLMRYTVTCIMARSYRMDPEITSSFFREMLRVKVFSLRWHYLDGYCLYIRNKYRKYTRKWKSAHGISLGIHAENDWW